MNTNRVSATLSQADQEAIMTALATIHDRLSFLIDLTIPDRAAIPKLGDKTRAFVQKAVDVAAQHPDMLSVPFMEEFRKDAELFEALAPIQLAIQLLEKKIDDTLTQVGGEAYAAARTIYVLMKAPFAKAALRTAADDLGKRFGRRPRATANQEVSSATAGVSSATAGVSSSTRLLPPAS